MSAFDGASHAKGIVLEKVSIKQKGRGLRSCVRVQLIKNSKVVRAVVPGESNSKFIEANDEVLLSKKKGREIHGVHYKVVKVAGCSFTRLVEPRFLRG